MLILSIIRKKYPVFVTPINVVDLNREMCSNKFLSHIDKEEHDIKVVYVKCDAQGNLDLRDKSKGRKEYRIYDVNKHEIQEHQIQIK